MPGPAGSPDDPHFTDEGNEAGLPRSIFFFFFFGLLTPSLLPVCVQEDGVAYANSHCKRLCFPEMCLEAFQGEP